MLIACVIGGIIFLAFAVFAWRSGQEEAERLHKDGIRATVRVIDAESRGRSGEWITLRYGSGPHRGKVVKVSSDAFPDSSVGSLHYVTYDPKDPRSVMPQEVVEDAVSESSISPAAGPAMLSGAMGVFFLAGAAAAHFPRRNHLKNCLTPDAE